MADKPDKDQKTEKPTPKRKREARKQGQIAKSPEVSSWVLVLAATYLLPGAAGSVYGSLQQTQRRISDVAVRPDARQASEVLGTALAGALGAILPFLALVAVIALVATLAQVGFVFTGKALKPKGTRVNPLAGIKRMFSMKSWWEAAKAFAKFALITFVAGPSIWHIAEGLSGGQVLELSSVLPFVLDESVSLVRTVAYLALGIAMADYLYQRRSIAKQLMMTKQELKQEFKNSEGDPMVKSKIRQLQRAASRNRMLAAIADANVVVMNPTHYAVALRYRAGEGAPRVVAKGKDNLALRIRDRAQAHDVPVVEAPPLARALYAACDLDQEVPVKLFNAVAKVLAFVHRLHGRRALSGVFVLPHIAVE